MTFRERIADWISGGALTLAKNNESYANRHMVQGYYGLRAERDVLRDGAFKFSAALCAIRDQEKPTSNATVKRMARIAKEALK